MLLCNVLLDLVGLDIEGMASLQNDLDNAVDLILFKQTVEQVEAAGVGRHAGTGDIDISLCQSLVYVGICLVYQLVYRSCTAAVLIAYDYAAVFFDSANDLGCRTSDGRTCEQDALAAFILLGIIFVLDLLCQSSYISCCLGHVETELNTVEDLMHFHTAHGRGIHLLQAIELLKSLALLVYDMDRLADIIFCDGCIKLLFENALKALDLFLEELCAHLTLLVGELEDMNILELCKHLIHLLLAVACCLADDKIGEIEEGALVGLGKAVARLDKGAKVAGQILLGIGNCFACLGAEAFSSYMGMKEFLRCSENSSKIAGSSLTSSILKHSP